MLIQNTKSHWKHLKKESIKIVFSGECKCGECVCKPGFKGKFCQTEIEKDICQKLEPCLITKFLSEGLEEEERAEHEISCGKNTNHNGKQIYTLTYSKVCFEKLNYTG